MKRFLLITLIMLLLSSCAPKEDTVPVQSSNEISSNTVSTDISESESQVALISDTLNGWSGKTIEEWGNSDSIPDWFPDTKPTKDEEGIFSKQDYEIHTIESSSDAINVEGEYSDIFPIVTNDTPLEDIISEIDEPYLYIAYAGNLSTGFAPLLNRPHISISLEKIFTDDNMLAGNIPIGFLRKTGHGEYYTVCKLKDGGYIYYLYAPRIMRDDRTLPFYSVDDDETDVYLWGTLYAENALSYADYSTIKIGSTLEDVIKIDSAGNMTLARFQYLRDVMGFTGIGQNGTQLMLLEDGILEIVYTEQDADSRSAQNYVISSMKFFPDFKYTSPITTERYGQEVEISINILPQDYPPAS